jgi:hypothetical protein
MSDSPDTLAGKGNWRAQTGALASGGGPSGQGPRPRRYRAAARNRRCGCDERGFPYHEKLGRKPDAKELQRLQIDLIKLQASLQKRGERLLVPFEGRDASGKSSAIQRFMAHSNPPCPGPALS